MGNVEPERKINLSGQEDLIPLGGKRKSRGRDAAEHVVATLEIATGLVFPIVAIRGLAEAGGHYLKQLSNTRRN